MSEATDAAENWFANHPKAMGALFTAMLLVAQSGSAAAHCTATAGP